MRRAIVSLGLAVMAAGLLAACGSNSDRAQQVTLAALNTGRTTATDVTGCSSSSVSINEPTTCSVLVSDTGTGTKSAPIGTVLFSSTGPGGFTTNPCTLAPVPMSTTSSCSVGFTPSAFSAGADQITAAYTASDSIHADSSDTAGITLTSTAKAQECTNRNVTASLTPPAVMPVPGEMPARSFMAAIKKRGHLIAGVDQNTLLLSYLNPRSAQLEGFEIDMLRDIANAIFGDKPNDIVFKAVTTAERLPAVQSGEVDIVADAATITCHRKLTTDFSTVYIYANQRLLVPSDSNIHSVKDLAGERVCATVGSTSIETLKKEAPGAVPVPVEQRTDCLVDLERGLVNAITSDDAILVGFKAQDPYTKIVGPPMAPEPYGVVVSTTHSDFVRFVNGVFAEMRKNGGWRSLYSRLLSSSPAARQLFPAQSPPPPKYQG
jgi:polar amino acid transport system substrate-binding protein